MGVDDHARFWQLSQFVVNHVGSSDVFVEETPHLKDPWRRNFDQLFGQLYFRHPLPIGIFESSQFVDTTQSRLVECGRQLRTDTPNRNLGPLMTQTLDQMLVQIVAGDNHGIGKT